MASIIVIAERAIVQRPVAADADEDILSVIVGSDISPDYPWAPVVTNPVAIAWPDYA
jgi:hypothetical protein